MNTLLEAKEEKEVWSNKFSDWLKDLESFASRAGINTRGPSRKYRDPTTACAMRLRESTKAKRYASPIQASSTKITTKVGESKRSKSLTPEDRFNQLTQPSENSQSTQQKRLFNTNLRKSFEIVCELEIDTKCNIFPTSYSIFQRRDLKKIAKKTKTNSAAGPDGLFLESWIWLSTENGADKIVELLKKFLFEKHVSAVVKMGKTILIPETKETNSNTIDDFRPIRVTSIWYRIFRGLVANRLNTLSDSFLHPSQRGFRKLDRCFMNIMEIKAALLFIEFKRAFDEINHYSMLQEIDKAVGKDFSLLVQDLLSEPSFECMHKNIHCLAREEAYKFLGIRIGNSKVSFNANNKNPSF
ncbi:hypothetical protein HZS_7483 [Henneguya salminicola]|nr:hypothetical protein HZS_7483 [Henneguya salminicola]